MLRFRSFSACLLAAASLFAQSGAKRTDSIVVTGTYEPLPLEEADRPVRSLDIRSLQLVSNTFADFLKLDSSLDLRQRGGNGIQGDLSIRGGSFGQTLVLLDGLRLNDVQSGHHNLDLPSPLESLERIEVLKGSGSTLYGSDAVGGVVHFITRTPETSELRLRGAAGSFGTNQQRGTLTLVSSRLTQQFAFSRDFSTGFIPNRDYRNATFGSVSRFKTRFGDSNLHLSHRDSPFGAEQFYGNFNSWERTKTWWAALRQTFGANTDASFAYRRHTDLFVLYRDRPQIFTNRHAVESYQAAVRRRDTIGHNAKLHYGIETYGDSIVSSNLGRHQRIRGAGYAALDVRALRRFSFTAGLRDEIYGSRNQEWSPTLSAGAWILQRLKVRAGVSRAFRLPTYTDLYYQDPANRGSADLRPESAWSFEGGADYNAAGTVRAEFTIFHRREKDGIDYVRYNPNDIWRATNFQNFRFTGLEAAVRFRLPRRQEAEVQYTGLRGAQAALGQAMSKYVFNYPVHNAVLSWQGIVKQDIVARTRVGIAQRLQREPYAVWDVYAASTRGRVRPFGQFTNLTSTRYEEIPRVAMPGRAFIAGIELVVFGAR